MLLLQGGSMLLEATTVTMFIECFSLYYQWISELWPSGPSSGKVVIAQGISEIAPIGGHPSISPQQFQRRKVMWDRVESVSLSLFNLSLVLVERDEYGMLSSFVVQNVQMQW